MANLMRKMWTKHQVKQIVNDGIQHGEITATRLYKHEIEIDQNNYVIITNVNESLVGSEIYDVLTGIVILQFIDLNTNYSEILSINDDGDELYYIDNTGSISNISLSDTEISSDTVIPL